MIPTSKRSELARRAASLALVAFGVALWAWLAYDAGSVRRALGLGEVASEGALAAGGLGLAAGSLIAGLAIWRRAVRAARAAIGG